MSPPVVLGRGVGGHLDHEIGLDAHHFDVLVAPVADVATADHVRPRVIARRWLDSGRRVERVDLVAQTVRFTAARWLRGS